MHPALGYVWVDGYYDWTGSRYLWMAGSWRRPPRPRAYRVPGRYEHHYSRQVWVRSRWRW